MVEAFLQLAVVSLPIFCLILCEEVGASMPIAFMGWFGPRGLASIVLGLVHLEQEKELPGEQITRLAVMATVLLSIFAHGISAQPGIRLHARLTGKSTN